MRVRVRSLLRRSRSLRREIQSVVESDNCSGCGACAAITPAVTMDLDDRGYLRPMWRASAADDGDEASELFRAVCPGVGVRRQVPSDVPTLVDPLFGPYLSAWTAWACDPGVRWSGSSAGVLTALSSWLLENGEANGVVSAAMSRSAPSRTVPVRLQTKEEVLATAGSRYAPVGTAALVGAEGADTIFVGKPCEVTAARRLDDMGTSGSGTPTRLSFFCAGVPSQQATERLIKRLGLDPGQSGEVRYRGRGWPGGFVVKDDSERSRQMSYEESWGKHLGPSVQDRCKICPDGTGGDADISVGDFWHADSSGYPLFTDSDGLSVAIARTSRGQDLLLRAVAAGIVAIEPCDLGDVAAVQPSQRRRQAELPGRLIGRLLGGRRVPRYEGFRLVRTVLRAPRLTVRAARGTFRRARKPGPRP